MTEPPRLPALTPRAAAEKQARAAREAKALRENLRRRKAQIAARRPDDEVTPHAPLDSPPPEG